MVIVLGTGFFLNNEMDDFTTRIGEKNLYGLVQGVSNVIAPKKQPLSLMAPTIVIRDGRISMVLGSPGGSRIHQQWLPDEVFYETRGLSADTLKILREMGYRMTEQTPWGAAELIMVGQPGTAVPSTGSGNDAALSGRIRPSIYYGAHDGRRPAGAAAGY